MTPTGSRGTGPRCRRAVAGPGRTTSQRTESTISAPGHHWCGGHRRVRRAWLQCSWAAEGPGWRLVGEPTSQAHVSTPDPHWCGGHRRVWRAWLQCSWAAEGPGWASRRRTSTRQHTNPHWCGGRRRVRRAWLRCPRAAAGPDRGTGGTGGPGCDTRGQRRGLVAVPVGGGQGQGGPRDRPLRAVRLACGDLAGGPPPTGTPSDLAHGSGRHNKTARPQWGRAAVAVALGFEPRVAVTPHSISSAAPSAARTRYLTRILYYTFPPRAQIDRACWEQGHTAA